MDINREYFTENPNQVVVSKTKKKQIVLAHTASNLVDYLTKITTRYHKKYNHLPAYVIALDGQVYQLYDPQYYSQFMEDESVDKIAIPVALENVGWVVQDPRDQKWYDWKGHEYQGSVVNVEWRNKRFWATYSDQQVESLVKLVDQLCDTHKIEKVFIGDNVTAHKPKTFKGVINRSNYTKSYYDLSPAMNFEKLTEQINGLAKPKKSKDK